MSAITDKQGVLSDDNKEINNVQLEEKNIPTIEPNQARGFGHYSFTEDLDIISLE